MTFLQIITNDIFLLVLIVGLLFYMIFTQRRLEMKIANMEAEYDLLVESNEGADPSEENTENTSNDTVSEDFKVFQEGVNKRLEENEQELKKVIEVLKAVTLEIKNLKDAVRERTVDLEL